MRFCLTTGNFFVLIFNKLQIKEMNEKTPISKPEWILISNYLNHEASSSEIKIVEKWASQSVQNRKELDETKKMLKNANLLYEVKKFDTNGAWKKIAKKTNSPYISRYKSKRKNGFFHFYKYAAVFLLALLLGSIGYLIGFNNDCEISNGMSSPGQFVVQEYTLPDGSVVTLNCNSKIKFPKKFKKEKREITIVGEAFFDVKTNPEKPFVINAGNARVTVLGTSFNISAFPEQEKVEVVVETGKVQFCRKERKEDREGEFILQPGEKGTLEQKTNHLEKNLNTDPNYLAWKTHNLVFKETPLSQVMKQLKKAYHIEIELKDKQLNELLLTAQFNKKPVEFILNVVQMTFNLNLTIDEKGQYILSEHK